MIERPSPEQIRIGRLQKKVEKLKKQLESRDKEVDRLTKILRYYPYAEQKYKLMDRIRTLEVELRTRKTVEELAEEYKKLRDEKCQKT
jgi:predicted component of type VI protein secretion system